MDVRTDDKLYNVYSKYLKWLNTHHPRKYTKKTTVEEFLFDPTRIQKAKSDPDFATSMFAKWKKNGFDSDEVHVKFQDMDLATDNALYKLYKDYFSWLTKNHPTPK
ncbi:hypothetical protein PInf_022024 [Phytophthora infestans]|nr:hypothetical protein PInf_022024 [Phytophthora infestans]